MSQKSKKKSIWHRCESCQSKLSVKDISLHDKKSCPPPSKSWVHSYVRDKILYTSVKELRNNEVLQYFPALEQDQVIWLSREVLRLCRWNTGDPVIVTMKGLPVVKSVWPCNETSLMGALMTRETIEGTWGTQKGAVTISGLPSQLPRAKHIVLSGKKAKFGPGLDAEHIVNVVTLLFKGKYLFTGTKLWLPYYGKRLLLTVKSVTPFTDTFGDVSLDFNSVETPSTSFVSDKSLVCDEIHASTPKRPTRNMVGSVLLERGDSSSVQSDTSSLSQDVSQKSLNISSLDASIKEVEERFSSLSIQFQEPNILSSLYVVAEETEFVLYNDDVSSDNIVQQRLNVHLFGMEELKTKLSLLLHQALDQSNTSCMRKQRGILLHGPSGTGKTALARILARDCGVKLLELQTADLYSKFIGETESRIKEFFDKAKSEGSVIVLLDKIDWLSPSNANAGAATDLGRRTIETLASHLDRLQDFENGIAVVATACSLDLVDSVLRRPGRIECEEEMPLPSPKIRAEILNALLLGTPHTLSEGDVQAIADCTHGFVGGDLYSLGSHSLLHMSEANRDQLAYEDFTWALNRVSPSAMREVRVDIPNVRWTDIAGQENLKLKLRQSVEWPLTHPEVFVRFGIRPPRGILMYGPPGCSKTMIAKAVASESKLNFISIKGSGLFSKWVGESERAVREVFRRARQVAPSIVFFDELDAIGGERFSSGGGGGTRNVESRVLTQLLTEMDGVEALEKVIVIGATNRPDRIDKALLRPGRMDNIVYVPLPDDATRSEIFRRQFDKMRVEFKDWEGLVRSTAGYSGAEVVAVCHEAGRRAIAENINADVVPEDHFKQALEEIKPRTPLSLLKLYEDIQNQGI